MKKITNYYPLIMMIIFIIYNIILENIKIGGVVYNVFMIIMIILNSFILILFRKNIKLKGLIITFYFFTWLIISKNLFQCFFALSTLIILIVVGFKESNYIKVMAFFVPSVFILLSFPILLVFVLAFGNGEERGLGDIYIDSHYICKNNYEAYAFSKAMDGYGYSIGKYYDFYKKGDIIYIKYSERNEVSYQKYNNYIKKNGCKLAGDINGLK